MIVRDYCFGIREDYLELLFANSSPLRVFISDTFFYIGVHAKEYTIHARTYIDTGLNVDIEDHRGFNNGINILLISGRIKTLIFSRLVYEPQPHVLRYPYLFWWKCVHDDV